MLPLVSYCERAVDGLWAEPLNTITNAAFILVAMQVWLQHRQQKDRSRKVLSTAIAILLTLVAIGSSLYHMAPGQLTLILDITPILSLFAVLTFSLLKSRSNLTVGYNSLLTVLLIASSLLLGAMPWLNGSTFYFPAWIAVLALSVLCWNTKDQWVGVALLCSFSVAVVARTIDQAGCLIVPFGTHFLWHLFAALSASLAVRLAR